MRFSMPMTVMLRAFAVTNGSPSRTAGRSAAAGTTARRMQGSRRADTSNSGRAVRAAVPPNRLDCPPRRADARRDNRHVRGRRRLRQRAGLRQRHTQSLAIPADQAALAAETKVRYREHCADRDHGKREDHQPLQKRSSPLFRHHSPHPLSIVDVMTNDKAIVPDVSGRYPACTALPTFSRNPPWPSDVDAVPAPSARGSGGRRVPSPRLLVRAGTPPRRPRHLHLLALGKLVYGERRAHRPRGNGRDGRAGSPLPRLLPREIYEQTGGDRVTATVCSPAQGTQVQRLTCSADARGTLHPAGEGEYSSYKDYPVSLYQIQTKVPRRGAAARRHPARGASFV